MCNMNCLKISINSIVNLPVDYKKTTTKDCNNWASIKKAPFVRICQVLTPMFSQKICL